MRTKEVHEPEKTSALVLETTKNISSLRLFKRKLSFVTRERRGGPAIDFHQRRASRAESQIIRAKPTEPLQQKVPTVGVKESPGTVHFTPCSVLADLLWAPATNITPLEG